MPFIADLNGGLVDRDSPRASPRRVAYTVGMAVDPLPDRLMGTMNAQLFANTAAVSRSDNPVTWSRTASALRALAVLSSAQHSIVAGSKTSPSRFWIDIDLEPRNCSLFD